MLPPAPPLVGGLAGLPGSPALAPTEMPYLLDSNAIQEISNEEPRLNTPGNLETGVVLTGGLTVLTAGILLHLASARHFMAQQAAKLRRRRGMAAPGGPVGVNPPSPPEVPRGAPARVPPKPDRKSDNGDPRLQGDVYTRRRRRLQLKRKQLQEQQRRLLMQEQHLLSDGIGNKQQQQPRLLQQQQQQQERKALPPPQQQKHKLPRRQQPNRNGKPRRPQQQQQQQQQRKKQQLRKQQQNRGQKQNQQLRQQQKKHVLLQQEEGRIQERKRKSPPLRNQKKLTTKLRRRRPSRPRQNAPPRPKGRTKVNNNNNLNAPQPKGIKKTNKNKIKAADYDYDYYDNGQDMYLISDDFDLDRMKDDVVSPPIKNKPKFKRPEFKLPKVPELDPPTQFKDFKVPKVPKLSPPKFDLPLAKQQPKFPEIPSPFEEVPEVGYAGKSFKDAFVDVMPKDFPAFDDNMKNNFGIGFQEVSLTPREKKINIDKDPGDDFEDAFEDIDNDYIEDYYEAYYDDDEDVGTEGSLPLQKPKSFSTTISTTERTKYSTTSKNQNTFTSNFNEHIENKLKMRQKIPSFYDTFSTTESAKHKARDYSNVDNNNVKIPNRSEYPRHIPERAYPDRTPYVQQYHPEEPPMDFDAVKNPFAHETDIEMPDRTKNPFPHVASVFPASVPDGMPRMPENPFGQDMIDFAQNTRRKIWGQSGEAQDISRKLTHEKGVKGIFPELEGIEKQRGYFDDFTKDFHKEENVEGGEASRENSRGLTGPIGDGSNNEEQHVVLDNRGGFSSRTAEVEVTTEEKEEIKEKQEENKHVKDEESPPPKDVIVLEEKSRVESNIEENHEQQPQYEDYYYQENDDYDEEKIEKENNDKEKDVFSNLAAIFPAPNFGSQQQDIFKKVKIDLGRGGKNDYPEVAQEEQELPYDYYYQDDGLETDFDRAVAKFGEKVLPDPVFKPNYSFRKINNNKKYNSNNGPAASYSSRDTKPVPTLATTLAMANEIKNDKKRRRLSELRRKRRRRKQNKKEEEPLIVEDEQRPKFERANFMLTPEAPKPTGKIPERKRRSADDQAQLDLFLRENGELLEDILGEDRAMEYYKEISGEDDLGGSEKMSSRMGENVDDYKLTMSPAVPNLNNEDLDDEDHDDKADEKDDPNIPDLFVKGKFGRKVTTTTKTTTTKATTTTAKASTGSATASGEGGYLSSLLPNMFSSRIGSIMPDMSGIPILGSFFGGGSTADKGSKDEETKKEEVKKDEPVVVLDQTVDTKTGNADDSKLSATENTAAVATAAGTGTSLGPTLMGLPVLPIIFTLSMIGLVFDTDLIPLPDSLNPKILTSGRYGIKKNSQSGSFHHQQHQQQQQLPISDRRRQDNPGRRNKNQKNGQPQQTQEEQLKNALLNENYGDYLDDYYYEGDDYEQKLQQEISALEKDLGLSASKNNKPDQQQFRTKENPGATDNFQRDTLGNANNYEYVEANGPIDYPDFVDDALVNRKEFNTANNNYKQLDYSNYEYDQYGNLDMTQNNNNNNNNKARQPLLVPPQQQQRSASISLGQPAATIAASTGTASESTNAMKKNDWTVSSNDGGWSGRSWSKKLPKPKKKPKRLFRNSKLAPKINKRTLAPSPPTNQPPTYQPPPSPSEIQIYAARRGLERLMQPENMLVGLGLWLASSIFAYNMLTPTNQSYSLSVPIPDNDTIIDTVQGGIESKEVVYLDNDEDDTVDGGEEDEDFVDALISGEETISELKNVTKQGDSFASLSNNNLSENITAIDNESNILPVVKDNTETDKNMSGDDKIKEDKNRVVVLVQHANNNTDDNELKKNNTKVNDDTKTDHVNDEVDKNSGTNDNNPDINAPGAVANDSDPGNQNQATDVSGNNPDNRATDVSGSNPGVRLDNDSSRVIQEDTDDKISLNSADNPSAEIDNNDSIVENQNDKNQEVLKQSEPNRVVQVNYFNFDLSPPFKFSVPPYIEDHHDNEKVINIDDKHIFQDSEKDSITISNNKTENVSNSEEISVVDSDKMIVSSSTQSPVTHSKIETDVNENANVSENDEENIDDSLSGDDNEEAELRTNNDQDSEIDKVIRLILNPLRS